MTSVDELLIRARRVFLPAGPVAASVGISRGLISGIYPYDTAHPAVEVVDLPDDQVLIPGIVDTHVHVNEPGRTHWEGFRSATRAALAGGVTTIIDMPLNSVPPTVEVEALHLKQRSAEASSHVDVGFWGGAIGDNDADLQPLHEAGVFGFKCFLVETGLDDFRCLTSDELARVMHRIAAFDGLLVVHAEDDMAIRAAPAAMGPSYDRFLRSRPDVCEERAVQRLVRLVEQTGCRVHIVHVASASVLEVLKVARGQGLPVTAETCPHYLTFSAEEIPEGGTQFKCCPPIREAFQRELLWDALVEGVLQIVVSDHSPSPAELKEVTTGDFSLAWGGVSSLQLSLPAVWTQARARDIPLQSVVEWMSHGPARLVCLDNKGAIEVGRDADLVAFAPDQSFVVDAEALLHRHPLTPYDRRALFGVVKKVWLRGSTCDAEQSPRGRLIRREG
ncbi:allantoinase AllB [Streptomyces sp. CLV115]|uniref:allantoinase AllB n=1 Tax=Streptomyces sp. CLV115 TaxID=3138502 RepID=UPI00313BA00B